MFHPNVARWIRDTHNLDARRGQARSTKPFVRGGDPVLGCRLGAGTHQEYVAIRRSHRDIRPTRPGRRGDSQAGNLQAPGHIAWKVEGKAGVAFSANVNVGDWLSRQVRGHQDQVDEIVSTLRSGKKAGSAPDRASIASDPSIDAELKALRADLVRLGNGLAGDAILVATHPEVQLIDIALQRVDRMIGQRA